APPSLATRLAGGSCVAGQPREPPGGHDILGLAYSFRLAHGRHRGHPDGHCVVLVLTQVGGTDELAAVVVRQDLAVVTMCTGGAVLAVVRSEERRVGRECR